jgi:hypothetical protein
MWRRIRAAVVLGGLWGIAWFHRESRRADAMKRCRREMFPLWARALGCAASLLLVAPLSGAQSDATRIRYSVGCPTCRVEFTPIVTIGKPADPATPSSTSGFDRDSRGRFFVMSDNVQLLVYGADGAFLEAIGRRGPGPGEFDVPGPMAAISEVVVGPGDTVFVFHIRSITVFSPELEHVRTIRMPARSMLRSINRVSDGSWVIGAAISRPENAGRSVHVLNQDGSVRRSLGPEGVVIPGRLFSPSWFRLAPDQRSVWLYTTDHRFRLEHWSLDNRRLASFEIHDVPDFPEPTFETRRTRDGRSVRRAVGGASVLLNGIDTLGQLWMVRGLPDAGESAYVLDIVDPRTGGIRLSQRMPMAIGLLRRGDIGISGTTDADGFRSYTLWRYRFVGG